MSDIREHILFNHNKSSRKRYLQTVGYVQIVAFNSFSFFIIIDRFQINDASCFYVQCKVIIMISDSSFVSTVVLREGVDHAFLRVFRILSQDMELHRSQFFISITPFSDYEAR